MLVKLAVVAILLAIIGSLVSALFFLVSERGDSRRVVKALAFRIALSIVAFGLLMLSYANGWITPNQPPFARPPVEAAQPGS